MRKNLLFLMAFAAIGWVSCSKDDKTVEPTRTELISKSWKISGLKMTMENVTYNLMDSLETCVADNVYIFSKDGTYKSEEGLTKCSESDPSMVESGTWAFTNNDSKLQIKVESWEFLTGSNAWEIVVLNATQLSIKVVVPAQEGIPSFTVELVFSAL